MTNHILITGGAGFIGSNFLRYVTKKYLDYFFIVLDNLTYAGHLSNIEDLLEFENLIFIKGSISDDALVDSIFSNSIDTVINFAAETHVDRSIQDAGVFIQTNVMGVNTLLKFSVRHKVEKFIQISTDEVYGSIDTGTISETSPLKPNNPYAATKAAGELLVRAYANTFGLHTCITRCSNNYGPYQLPEKFIPLVIGKALRDEPIPIYGTGQNVRDWIHVVDHCRAIDTVLHKGRPGEIYNIGATQEITNLTLVKAILSYLEKPDTLINFVADRPGHDLRYALDNTKIRRELNWSPSVNFKEGIISTIDWYRKNQAWTKKVYSC